MQLVTRDSKQASSYDCKSVLTANLPEHAHLQPCTLYQWVRQLTQLLTLLTQELQCSAVCCMVQVQHGTFAKTGSTGRKAEWLKLHSSVEAATTSSSSRSVRKAAASNSSSCSLCSRTAFVHRETRDVPTANEQQQRPHFMRSQRYIVTCNMVLY